MPAKTLQEKVAATGEMLEALREMSTALETLGKALASMAVTAPRIDSKAVSDAEGAITHPEGADGLKRVLNEGIAFDNTWKPAPPPSGPAPSYYARCSTPEGIEGLKHCTNAPVELHIKQQPGETTFELATRIAEIARELRSHK